MALKCALVGCGAISAKHLQAFADNRNAATLLAVCDVDSTRAEVLVANDPTGVAKQARVFSDYRQMLREIKPDVVAIATPTRFHFQIAIDSMETGAHVIVEKPMALSTVEAERMVETARKKNVKLTVCYITRFAPHIKLLRKLMDDGRFGRIYYSTLQIRWNRSDQYYREAAWRGTWEADGGMLMNQGTHGIDLLSWLMGEKVRRTTGVIRRFSRPIESEDFASAVLEFENGSIGMIEGTVLVYPKNLESSLSFFGEKGTVVIGGNHIDTLKTWSFADTFEGSTLEAAKGLIEQAAGQKSGHSALYQDFFQAIDGNTEPAIDGVEGKRSIDIVLSIYKAAQEEKSLSFPVQFSTAEMSCETILGK